MGDLRNMLRVTVFGSRNKAGRGAASFDPTRDIPSLAGRVVLITGAAGDIGRVTATELAGRGRPARVYVADLPPRDEGARAQLVDRITREARAAPAPGEGPARDGEAAATTEVRFLDLDLGSFESVRRCAAEFLARERRLDILVLNAGIIRVAAGVTKEGHESHFGINYLGHALLVKLLTPIMLDTCTAGEQREGGGNGHVRVVVVSSEGHLMAPKQGVVFETLRTDCAKMPYTERYGQSKLALIHLTQHLARTYPQFEVVAVHPGRVNTGIGVSLAKESLLIRLSAPIAPFMSVTPEVGARNHLWAATSPDVVSGKYYTPVGVPDMEGKLAKDDVLAQKIWEWTEKELEEVPTSAEHTSTD